ncbi:TM2 domain-containing protein [Draconibacterium halophilum]|uniref:TM2 domain-containing protein n=1 Tax=Draconibacterium halophilum TaxID=2706887 RepID=A0A6C0RAN5_9BACT|nr:TM2 domain-containing protein [Draconibacterium halophilum]QIA06815.1 TM2 domain-containing protein [Draconibacterium halophilum]
MKKVSLAICLLLAVFFVKSANASSYSIDMNSIDKMFSEAVETSMVSMNAGALSTLPSNAPATAVVKEKSFVAAVLLDFFLGGFGVHRFYLGTKTMTGVGYILTCGGIFGIVPFVDLIVLIVDNDDISPYIDNPKFFMW